MVLIGIGSAAGHAALVWFNSVVFGSPSITGGYSGSFATRAASFDVLDYLGNIILALVHLERGLLIFSPFLILLIPGLRAGWRAAPAWVRGSAVGGLLYLLLQLKANRYSGGVGFWGYRYPLETLAAAAPLLLLSYTEWLRHRSDLLQRVFLWLIAGSIGLTALGAVVF
jgi:alpha-1,2-mannosyltransferase